MKIITDIDDVVKDLHGFIFHQIHQVTGELIKREAFNDWDIFAKLSPGLTAIKDHWMAKEGTVTALQTLPGALETLETLRSKHHVIAVTSPYSESKTWVWERQIDLKNLGFKKNDTIFSSGKFHVPADVFIDDCPDNCINWHQAHPNKLCCLVTYPNTENVELPPKVKRIKALSEILDIIM